MWTDLALRLLSPNPVQTAPPVLRQPPIHNEGAFKAPSSNSSTRNRHAHRTDQRPISVLDLSTYPIAMEGWRPLRTMGHERPGAEVREADRELRVPGGGVIEVRSADNPQRLRGAGLDFVVLDEAAFIAQETWTEALRPALSDRRGGALFISTPKGHNWFFDLFEQASVLDDWARWQLPTSANPSIEPAELDQARSELGAMVFSQEYLPSYETATKVEIEVASDEGKARSANVMNADLAKAKVYNKLQQKQITAWQGIRNSAAHGKYDEYKAGDVERLIEGVRDILLRFPA